MKISACDVVVYITSLAISVISFVAIMANTNVIVANGVLWLIVGNNLAMDIHKKLLRKKDEDK